MGLPELNKKLNKLSNEYDRTPKKAVVKRQRIMKSAESVQADIDSYKKQEDKGV